MLPGIERYLKQAIVDKNRALASAALVSSLVCQYCFCIISPWSKLFLLFETFKNLISYHLEHVAFGSTST